MCTQAEPSWFEALVEALNKNSGAIQAVSTIVLVGITWWYARLTQRLARTAKEQLQESRDVRREQAQEELAGVKELLLQLSTALGETPTDASLIRIKHLAKVLSNYDNYQREFTRGGVVLPAQIRSELDIISDSLRRLHTMAGRDVNLGLDDVVYYADLPLASLREATAKALKYLSNPTDQRTDVRS